MGPQVTAILKSGLHSNKFENHWFRLLTLPGLFLLTHVNWWCPRNNRQNTTKCPLHRTLSQPIELTATSNQCSKNSPTNQSVFQGLPFFYYVIQDICWRLRNRRSWGKRKTSIFWRLRFPLSVELQDRFSKSWNPIILSFILMATKESSAGHKTDVPVKLLVEIDSIYSELSLYFQYVCIVWKQGYLFYSEVRPLRSVRF